MQCPRCRHKNPARAKFCEECATPLVRTCANCGNAIAPTARFCPACAHPVNIAAPARPRYATPAAYTPRHLAERILVARNTLEGERKQVTVLFADLKGSLELLADRDPEDARRLLDPVLERMVEAVHRYEGTVNQVMGDGIMALFGAPVAHEDHAVRACYAALDMQAALHRHADALRRNEGVDVQVRVGLNSGEVVVRAIGSDLRMDYSAVGPTTHLAARMEQLARPGSSLLTADTLRLAEGYVEVRPLGPVPVKGLDHAVEVFELAGAGPVRSRLQALAVRGLTPFVGRDTELEQLRQALARAGAGHGELVAIVGEPGVGKSRLVWELTHSHRTHGWLVLHAGTASYGKATPYLPVIDLLRTYFHIEPRDDARTVREKITGKLLSLDRALEPFLPALLSLLDIATDDAHWEQLDPPQRRQRTLDGIKRLLLRESEMQPLLLAVEDLHWIDSESQALLDSLVQSLPAARLLVLTDYRPEYEHRWGGKTYYTQLRLDPLAPESAEVFLRALLGDDPALRPLKQVLIDRTDGNPFFLEESVRTLIDTGVLAGARGAQRLAKPVDSIRMPATVQAVLAARIDRLAPAHKRLLECAAVVGKDVPLPLLDAIAAMAEPDLRRALTELQAAEFLYETSLYPVVEYTFKHALTHEVAYGTLLHEQRRTLHAHLVEAIERLHADRLAEHVERLAHHAFSGEVWNKAVSYQRQAGSKALERSLLGQAAAYFEQALTALGHLADSDDTREQSIDLHFALRNAYSWHGDHDKVQAHLLAAESLAIALRDQRRLGQMLSYESGYFYYTGSFEQAIDAAQRALRIAEQGDDIALLAEVRLRMAFVQTARGEFDRATELTERNIAALTGDISRYRIGGALTAVVSAFLLNHCLAEQGCFDRAITLAQQAIRSAEAVPDTRSVANALMAMGFACFRQGDLPQAIAALERALDLCRTYEFALFQPRACGHLGAAYALSGRPVEAIPLLVQAIELTGREQAYDALFTAELGEAHLLAGHLDEACRFAGSALALARERKERGHEAWVLRLFGEIHSRCGPAQTKQAVAAYEAAAARATELRMRPLLAHCRFGLGTLHRREGQRAKAEEHLGVATALYREMNMAFWLARVETGTQQER